MLITIATVLSTFNISKAVEENGQVIEPSAEFISAHLRSVHSRTEINLVILMI